MDEKKRERDHLSPSSLCDLARCGKRFYFRDVMRIERVSTERDLAMRFGRAIHEAMPFTFTREIEKAIEAFEKVWEDGDDYEDKKRTSLTGKNILIHLTNLHSSPTYRFRFESSEEEFEVDVGLKSGRLLMGRIDGFLIEKETDERWLVDFKTTSQLWGSFRELFVLHPQPLIYLLATKLMGWDVKGMIIEGILVAKTRVDCITVPVEMPSEELFNEVLDWIRRMDEKIEKEEFEKNFAACSPYAMFGSQGYPCEFLPLCLAGERWRELLGMYQERREEI